MALPTQDENALLHTLLLWSLDEASTQQHRDAVYHIIGSVVNKRVEGLSLFLSEQLDAFWIVKVADASVGIETRRKAISAWVWVCRLHELPFETERRCLLANLVGCEGFACSSPFFSHVVHRATVHSI